MTFDEAFEVLMEHEGGYVNNASDPGGKTRFGITEATARAHGYFGDMRDLPREVAKEVYKESYWTPAKVDLMPQAVKYPLFDAAVNSGPKQAIKWLQRAVGATTDGVVGPVTLSAVQGASPDKVAAAMIANRLEFMTNLPTWGKFGKGWARRIAAIL